MVANNGLKVTKNGISTLYDITVITHVGNYDRANDRPKLAMLAIDIGPMIDRIIAGLCWLVILTSKSFPIIDRALLPELNRRPFKFIMILIMTLKLKTDQLKKN